MNNFILLMNTNLKYLLEESGYNQVSYVSIFNSYTILSIKQNFIPFF